MRSLNGPIYNVQFHRKRLVRLSSDGDELAARYRGPRFLWTCGGGNQDCGLGHCKEIRLGLVPLLGTTRISCTSVSEAL